MEAIESPSAQDSSPEAQASILINRKVKETQDRGSVSHRDLAERIEQDAEEQEVPHELITRYVTSLRGFHHGAVITTLPEGVGGQFDGSSVEIAAQTVSVENGDVSHTIAQMEEVNRHEAYHALHHHTEVVVSEDSPISVILADEGLKTEEFIEGLTVAQTGNQFVSEEYRQYERAVRSGVRRAGITLEEAEQAIAA